ncbi:hypothetical protein BDV41DRAFT_516836, partial [Aspergillus transmontanensis]
MGSGCLILSIMYEVTTGLYIFFFRVYCHVAYLKRRMSCSLYSVIAYIVISFLISRC